MSCQSARCAIFRALHYQKGDPLVLYNIWDAGSAKIVAQSGAKALATGSNPVATAMGYEDGEKIPFDLCLDNIRRILETGDLPVSMDLEGGYGASPDQVAATAKQAAEIGIVGFNLEDQIIGGEGLYSIPDQVARIEAARRAVDTVCPDIFINARTDIFLKTKDHDASMVDAAIERANAYEAAGANGFFAPGLVEETLIEQLCSGTELPVNIIALPTAPDKETLASLGVARISHGPVPYKKMSAWLSDQAKAAFA